MESEPNISVIWTVKGTESESVSCSVMSASLQPHGLGLPGRTGQGILQQEHRSRLPISSSGHLPDPRIETGSPTSQADSLPDEP